MPIKFSRKLQLVIIEWTTVECWSAMPGLLSASVATGQTSSTSSFATCTWHAQDSWLDSRV